MKSLISHHVRRASLFASVSVLAVSLAGCGMLGGDGGKTDASAKPTTKPTAEKTTEKAKETPSSSSDSSESAAAEPLTPEDLENSKTVLHDLMAAMAAKDYQGACSFVADPMTEGKMSDTDLAACAEGMSKEFENNELPAGAADAVTPDKLDAKDNGDGTATLSVKESGQEMPFKTIKGSDGKMYIDSTSVQG